MIALMSVLEWAFPVFAVAHPSCERMQAAAAKLGSEKPGTAPAPRKPRKVTVQEAHTHLDKLSKGKGPVSTAEHQEAANTLSTLSVRELSELHSKLGSQKAPPEAVSEVLHHVMATNDLGAPPSPPAPSIESIKTTGPISGKHIRDAFARQRQQFPEPSAAAKSAAAESNRLLKAAGGKVADLKTAEKIGKPLLDHVNRETAKLSGEVAKLEAAVKGTGYTPQMDAELTAKSQELAKARTQATGEVLRAVRPVGAPENYAPSVAGEGHKTLEALASASNLIPTDWLGHSAGKTLSLSNVSGQGIGGSYGQDAGDRIQLAQVGPAVRRIIEEADHGAARNA